MTGKPNGNNDSQPEDHQHHEELSVVDESVEVEKSKSKNVVQMTTKIATSTSVLYDVKKSVDSVISGEDVIKKSFLRH